MKNQSFQLLGICLILGLFLVNATSLRAQTSTTELQKKSSKTKKMENTKTIKIEVKGMSCQEGCANGLDAAFKKVPGIIKSTTTFDNSLAEITFDKTIITEKQILEIIEKRGFQAKLLEKTNIYSWQQKRYK